MTMTEDHGIFYDVFPAALGGGSPCACCFPSALLSLFIALFLAVHISFSVLSYVIPFKVGKTILQYVGYALHAAVLAVAVFFGALMRSKVLRDWFFFQFALMVIAKDKPADVSRCDHFRGIAGRVLELGPGPGTNFRCWANGAHNITEWVGVEPNERFAEVLEQEKRKRNVTFPTRTVWLRGEDVDVDAGSFDVVVGSHVLCSVSDTRTVLQQVHRALRPGGTYLFYEHVAASEGSAAYYAQLLVQPALFFVGNGCQFKRLWQELSPDAALRGFDVSLTHTSVPIGLSFLAPHVVGAAVKR